MLAPSLLKRDGGTAVLTVLWERLRSLLGWEDREVEGPRRVVVVVGPRLNMFVTGGEGWGFLSCFFLSRMG